MKHRVLAVATASILLAFPAARAQTVQERIDLAAVQRIRDEGLNRSKLDSLIGYLTDVIGGRLTNSPGNRKANAWAAETFRSWGLANVAIEPWDSVFGRGWEQVSFSARVIEPVTKQLHATPQAWSGSTRGTVTCPVVLWEVQDTTQLASMAAKLKGACVLTAPFRPIGPEFEPITRRQTLDQLFTPPSPPPAAQPPPPQQQGPTVADIQRRNFLFRRFMYAEMPAALLRPSGWTYGLLRTGGHQDGRLARDSVYNPIPDLQVGHEQYGQLWRNAKRGIPQRLEINVQNRFHDDDRRGYNVLAEIPGGEKADEVVMLGAHFDSWHSGTGATDNAAGSVIMMEAVRILKTLGLPMKRTVRIGLWSGEEQGLLGSRAWVRMHQDQHAKISAYVNIDNGSGKVRGIWNQSNAAVTPIFEQILSPFRDLGVMTVRHGNTGGTDHLMFDAAGIPGFNFIQDPIEYGIRSHHSYVDTYERLMIDDLKQAATVVAWTVFMIANRDELMPRKPPRTTTSN
ncbi:MAG: M20/M25/M40 family metallo-hydrolase [Gemmatimonadales bacterium]